MRKCPPYLRIIAGVCGWLAVSAPVGAEDNTSLIINGTTTNIGGDLNIGLTGTNNSLQILNGGSVTNVEGRIGSGVNAHYNFAIITNSGSLWYNSSFLRPGFFGDSNSVIIADGGTVSALGTLIGDQSTAQYNTMLVTGGGILTNSSTLWVGNAGGHSQLTIADGGKVYNNAAILANSGASVENSVLVTGSSSLWASGSDISIGSSAGSTLNSVTVTDGALLTSAATVFSGVNGHQNHVTVTNGGRIFSNQGLVGNGASGSNNLVLITGNNSIWSNNLTMFIGNVGSGNQVTISDAGELNNGVGIIANTASSTGNTVLVTGNNALWRNRTELHVGHLGQGNQLIVTNMGRVVTPQTVMGNNASSSNNTVLVTGNGILTNTGAIYVGNNSVGNQLIIAGGGKLYSGVGVFGNSASSSNNTALVTGSGSLWKNNGDLSIGNLGGGNRLTIADSGQLQSAAYVGLSSGGNQLVITNGGQAIGGGSVISYQPVAANNSAVVTGAGSLWSNTVFLYVGFNGGNASLMIANGGQVVNPSGLVGGLATSSNNTVLIAGAGSLWRNTDFFVGTNATTKGSGAQVLVTDGGTLESFNWTGGLNNSATISNRQGIYQFPTATPNITPNTAGSFVITNGTISYRDVTAANIYNGQVANILFQGNNTFQLLRATNSSIASYVFDSVANTGTATNYQRLALNNGRWQSTTLAIGGGGALIGNGTVASTTVTNSGTIAPGFSAGALTFTGNLVLGSTSVLEMEIGGTGLSDYDRLIVGGSVTVTGILDVAIINAFSPAVGDTFTLIDNQGANPISGLFNGLTNNAFIDASANGIDAYFRVQYDGGTGNDLVLIGTIPEPSALALLCLGVGWFIVLRRRNCG